MLNIDSVLSEQKNGCRKADRTFPPNLKINNPLNNVSTLSVPLKIFVGNHKNLEMHRVCTNISLYKGRGSMKREAGDPLINLILRARVESCPHAFSGSEFPSSRLSGCYVGG